MDSLMKIQYTYAIFVYSSLVSISVKKWRIFDEYPNKAVSNEPNSNALQ